MEAVKAFTFELYSIMDMKPPISKAKMTAITRNAIKAIKLYKHVVQCVEKFIQKCKPEYKIPGLYVIDSIVRQSRHQFGNDKDLFAPRFARNLRTTFTHLFACPEEDKSKVIRVLNLWQKNAVFTTDIIQPIFDLAANPDYSDHSHLNPLSTTDNSPKLSVKTDLFKTQENTPIKDDISKSFDGLQSQSMESDTKIIDPAILEHIQAIKSLLKKQPGQLSTSPQVKKSDGVKLFDKKILDYDYGDDEEEILNQSPEFQQHQHQNPAIEGLDSLLSNPEVLRTLRNVEGLMSTQSKQQAELDKIKEMRKEAEFDKHLAQTVQNLPFASECELKPAPMVSQTVNMISNPYVNQVYSTQNMYQQQQSLMALEAHHKPLPQIIPYDDPNQSKPEVIDLDHIESPPPNKRDSRRDGYTTNSARKRSPRKSSRERQREREKDRERDRERRKRYLPPLKKNHLAVVSTTLWVGHLSKLIHQDDLYGLFQPIGDIVSLNLISPRGCAFLCMNRRQDAARIMSKYQGERLQGKPMTIAWAPGQAMKDKEWKDYWEIDDGVSYIPWEKLNKEIDYDELEVGGMLDEDTMPEWLKTHLKNLRTSKKNEKKEEEKLTEGNQQPLGASNFFDTQGVQSPSVQMQMSPAQNSQPNQMNFNMPQTMSMPNPFGINPRLINPMMNPMIPGTMAPMSMGHPSMMMMNRMPSPFGPPPNLAMMGNPQQMTMTSDAQKSLSVPTDMMMSFPFGMNLPSQAAAISSAQTIMGMNPPTVTSGTNTAPALSHTSQKDNLITTNPSNQLDPTSIMQFNLPPPTLSNLSNFSQNANNSNMGNEKYDPNTLGNSDQEELKDIDRNNEREGRNRGRDNRNRSRDSRERNDRFKDRENKNDRGRKDDLPRLDPRNRLKGPEQRERKSSRWGDKVNEEVDSPNNVGRLTVKEGLSLAQAPNLAQIDNVKDILIQNNSLHQILEHVIQDNMGNPPFQSPAGMFRPNGPLPNQIFNMPPQSFPQDGPRPPLLDNGSLRGRGGWNRGGRGGFRGRGGYNNGSNWDNNNGPNWDNSSGPNWDSNAPPPVWQNQSINRGGMMGRGNLRPPLMQNVMGRGRDNWIDNNSSGGRGGRDSDNWGGRGGGRDADKWGGRGGNRDSEGWSGRGSRPSPWRGNGNRRRNDDWENPNQKRWRRDDNSEYDEQPKIWKRGAEEEEWQNKQGSQWPVGKKDDGNYFKFKSRENNEERLRKPSKWEDKDPDDTVKEDLWNRKSVPKDESTIDESLHQTSIPMDLDNYEGDGVDNIEQLHGDQETENSNINHEIRQHEEFEKDEKQEIQLHDESGGFNNVVTHDQDKESVQQTVDEDHNVEYQQLKDNQDDFSNNLQQSPPHNNIEGIQQYPEGQLQDDFEPQNLQNKNCDEYISHNDYRKNTHDDIDSQHDNYNISQNDRESDQNQQLEAECKNMMSDNNYYDQSYDEESLQNLNSQEHSVNNFVAQANNETYKEKSQDLPGNLYFGTDNEMSLNKPVEIEQQNNEILPTEDIGIVSADNNEMAEINTAESKES